MSSRCTAIHDCLRLPAGASFSSQISELVHVVPFRCEQHSKSHFLCGLECDAQDVDVLQGIDLNKPTDNARRPIR